MFSKPVGKPVGKVYGFWDVGGGATPHILLRLLVRKFNGLSKSGFLSPKIAFLLSGGSRLSKSDFLSAKIAFCFWEASFRLRKTLLWGGSRLRFLGAFGRFQAEQKRFFEPKNRFLLSGSSRAQKIAFAFGRPQAEQSLFCFRETPG